MSINFLFLKKFCLKPYLYYKQVPFLSGIELVFGNYQEFDFSEEFFGAIVQYPGKHGQVYDYKDFVENANANRYLK